MLNTKYKILILGKNGQLSRAFQKSLNQNYNCVALSSEELNLLDIQSIDKVLMKQDFNILINCSAYTEVDKAESEKNKALLVNAQSLNPIIEICNSKAALLVHFSTDYIFNSVSSDPIFEQDTPNPINFYGFSKLLGERFIQEKSNQYIIIRTSWLYSEWSKNFVKTILTFAQKKSSLNVVNDQIGRPTNAQDLAEHSLLLIDKVINSKPKEIFHYSNSGQTSWYEFAREIIKQAHELNLITTPIKVNPISTFEYDSFTKRPLNNVLSLDKFTTITNIDIPYWKTSLRKMLSNFKCFE